MKAPNGKDIVIQRVIIFTGSGEMVFDAKENKHLRFEHISTPNGAMIVMYDNRKPGWTRGFYGCSYSVEEYESQIITPKLSTIS